MTKKDYIKFAGMFKDVVKFDVENEDDQAIVNNIINKTCHIFKSDNSLFNEDKFKEAIYKNYNNN